MARNLLIVISDEHRRDAMGCMGHPVVQTPHLDALAARGTVFTNAYTPSPMCVPTRAALATGQPVHRTGYWDSAHPYDGRVRSWMHALTTAGIETVSIGKLHFRDAADDTGFARQILPMHVVGGVGWTVGLLRRDPPPYDVAAELAQDVGIGESSYTAYDRAITAAAAEWLSAPPDRPWAAFVSLVSPHYPLTAPAAFHALYDPADMPPPIGALPDHPEIGHLAAFFDYDRHFDPERMRAAKAAYFGLTSFMDACVGQILAALEAGGQAEDTVILYVSDHGEMLGDHGLWTKQVMYEASAGVPMILAGPGIPGGRSCATAASLFDIAPTAAEVTGAPADPAWIGDSLLPLARGADDPDRVAFSEYHDGGSSTGAFMIRWDRWKYVEYPGQAPQLFDLAADPDELADLAATAEAGPVLAEGAVRLREICDPEAVNARCFADQAARIAALGGETACREAYVFNHTPTPTEQARLAGDLP
ncbi:MAG: sulfatase-like hydrolase/transferase [Pseudomonadota bacterium]